MNELASDRAFKPVSYPCWNLSPTYCSIIALINRHQRTPRGDTTCPSNNSPLACSPIANVSLHTIATPNLT